MIKVYQVSRRYRMLFMHSNKYLPLTGLLTLLTVNLLLRSENVWRSISARWRCVNRNCRIAVRAQAPGVTYPSDP